MDFVAEMKLFPKNGIGVDEDATIGYLFLEAWENGVFLCRHRFEIEYSSVPDGECWMQTLGVNDGQEQIFFYRGMVDQKDPKKGLDDGTRVKFTVFFDILNACTKRGGAFRGVIGFSKPSPEVIATVFQLCRGTVQ